MPGMEIQHHEENQDTGSIAPVFHRIPWLLIPRVFRSKALIERCVLWYNPHVFHTAFSIMFLAVWTIFKLDIPISYSEEAKKLTINRWISVLIVINMPILPIKYRQIVTKFATRLSKIVIFFL